MEVKEILDLKKLINSQAPVADILKNLEVYIFKNDKSLNNIISDVVKSERGRDEKVRILRSLLK